MLIHRYIEVKLFPITKSITVKNVINPGTQNTETVLIDLATGKVAVDAGVFQDIAIEGFSNDVYLTQCKDVWQKLLTDRAVKPKQQMPKMKGLDATERAIELLTDFMPCTCKDNDACESHLSLRKGCTDCQFNENEKSK